MGRGSFVDAVRSFIVGIAWHVFLWGIKRTEEKYWEEIYQQEIAGG